MRVRRYHSLSRATARPRRGEHHAAADRAGHTDGDIAHLGRHGVAEEGPTHVSYRTILVEQQDGVTTITLNRPDVLNAMNNSMRQELCVVFANLMADTMSKRSHGGGGERAFSAGSDILEFVEPLVQTTFREERKRLDFRREMDRCPQPITAAICGFALGGGQELALACDIRIAAEDPAARPDRDEPRDHSGRRRYSRAATADGPGRGAGDGADGRPYSNREAPRIVSWSAWSRWPS